MNISTLMHQLTRTGYPRTYFHPLRVLSPKRLTISNWIDLYLYPFYSLIYWQVAYTFLFLNIGSNIFLEGEGHSWVCEILSACVGFVFVFIRTVFSCYWDEDRILFCKHEAILECILMSAWGEQRLSFWCAAQLAPLAPLAPHSLFCMQRAEAQECLALVFLEQYQASRGRSQSACCRQRKHPPPHRLLTATTFPTSPLPVRNPVNRSSFLTLPSPPLSSPSHLPCSILCACFWEKVRERQFFRGRRFLKH